MTLKKKAKKTGPKPQKPSEKPGISSKKKLRSMAKADFISPGKKLKTALNSRPPKKNMKPSPTQRETAIRPRKPKPLAAKKPSPQKSGPRPASPYKSKPTSRATRILALLKDPKWAYCFWSLGKEQKKEEALRQSGRPGHEAKTILRVWDRTEPGDVTSFDIEPGEGVESYYVRLDANKRYSFEIGLSSSRGEFHSMAGTDVIQTPRMGPAKVWTRPATTMTEPTITMTGPATTMAGPATQTKASPPQPTKSLQEEKKFARIYALSHGVEEGATPEEIREIVGNLPAVFSPGS